MSIWDKVGGIAIRPQELATILARFGQIPDGSEVLRVEYCHLDQTFRIVFHHDSLHERVPGEYTLFTRKRLEEPMIVYAGGSDGQLS